MNELTELIAVSPSWDHQKTISALICDCDDVYVVTDFRHHHSDNGYGGIAVLIPHKDKYGKKYKGYTIVTTDADGVCYDGDQYDANILSNPNAYKVSTMEAFTILEKYRNLMIAREELEHCLVSSPIDRDCVNIVIDSSYTLENSRY